jgi:sirohydrochlorin ferrochelatase
MTANDAVVKATAATAQNAAHEKAALEAKVAELEKDLLVAIGADLRTVNRQFSEVTNKLQEVTDEATRLRDANSKLSQDVDGERALVLSFTLCSLSFTNTYVRSGTRSPVFFDLSTMSSTYALMMRPMSSPNMHRMHLWNVAPAFLSPKGIVL